MKPLMEDGRSNFKTSSQQFVTKKISLGNCSICLTMAKMSILSKRTEFLTIIKTFIIKRQPIRKYLAPVRVKNLAQCVDELTSDNSLKQLIGSELYRTATEE